MHIFINLYLYNTCYIGTVVHGSGCSAEHGAAPVPLFRKIFLMLRSVVHFREKKIFCTKANSPKRNLSKANSSNSKITSSRLIRPRQARLRQTYTRHLYL